MERQTVIVIQDASREVNLKVFEWALRGLSLMPGDMLILIVVMHQIITPMGYKSSVDNRLMFGANQKIIEEQAAQKKKEILNNAELAETLELYKSKKLSCLLWVLTMLKDGRESNRLQLKPLQSLIRTSSLLQIVVFKIEMAKGSSPKAVALKSAMKLKATWLILDRKMKNDEEYFLQKLSCGILRIRRFNKIDRIRGPLHLPQETQQGSTHETYLDSMPPPDSSTEPDPDLLNIEISPLNNKLTLQQVLGQNGLHDVAECSTSDQLSIEDKERDQLWQDAEQIGSMQHGKESDQKLKKKFKENNRGIADGGNREINHESLSMEVYQKGERCPNLAGARSFYLGGAEEYRVCENFFNLSNFRLRD